MTASDSLISRQFDSMSSNTEYHNKSAKIIDFLPTVYLIQQRQIKLEF